MGESSRPQAAEAPTTAAWSVSVDPNAPAIDESALRARTHPARGAPAHELELALALTRERHGVDFGLARARAGIARGHLLEVVLEVPGGRANAEEHAAADTLLELLLGEAGFEDWIGAVTVLPGPRAGPLRVMQARAGNERFFALAELAPALGAAIAGVHAGLPSGPLWSLGGEQRWFLLELEGSAEAAAPGADVALVSTFMPELLKSYLSGSPFASTRFSRAAELFAHLRYESGERQVESALARRCVLEDALDAALVSERAGRVIGGGLGVGHCEVHFAFDRVARAVAIVREVAAKVGVHGASSSIRFCDRALLT
jgi:hypothetical protein